MSNGGGVLGYFARHKVAANLVMLVMILGGILAISRMNIQFFPSFALDVVSVRVVWSGASAEDVEQGVTNPLEQRLRSVDGLKRMTSTSAQGVSSITLEFEERTNPIQALDDVRQQVDEFTNLPAEAEEPRVARVARYEPVGRLLVSGNLDRDELRQLAYQYEEELLQRGIDRISLRGVAQQQISLEVPLERLESLGLTLDGIADRVRGLSQDLPAGMMAQRDSTRELRSVEQRRSAQAFETLPIISDERRQLRLGDIAYIRQEARENQVQLSSGGRPAVELELQRAETGNSLAAAEILNTWLADTRPRLPPGIDITVYDETWQLLDERISLLIKNGAGGLLLVIILLALFLPGRVAFWVAVGIPTAFLAALAVLWGIGGSINMISLFALIMALGVIVDDAIVVGEDADAQARQGSDPLRASENAARRMLWPVLASSLTTVAAFMPLLVVGGVIGNILGDIPLVMICVLIASLLECFIVLPAHLRHAFAKGAKGQALLTDHGDRHSAEDDQSDQRDRHSTDQGDRHSSEEAPTEGQALARGQAQQKAPGPLARFRAGFEQRFDHFRHGPFRRFSRYTLKHRGLTLASAVTVVILTVGLLAGGRLGFNFFPSPEPTVIFANASFVAGTHRDTVDDFLGEMQQALNKADAQLGGGLVRHAITSLGSTQGIQGSSRSSDELGSILVELISSDERTVRNPAFIAAWRNNLTLPAGLDNLIIAERQSGPPGQDINVRLTGESAVNLKRAAESLAQSLKTLPGILDTEDDMPWGREQLIYQLSPQGEALGLTTEALGRQLRAAFDGRIAQIYQDGRDEVEVRVQLPRDQRESLGTLSRLSIQVPDGRFVPLTQVMNLDHRQGFQSLRHAEGQLAVEVSASLDTSVSTAADIIASLEQNTLPTLARDFGLSYSFEGRAADQRETLNDMRTGLLVGLALMYVVLTWVFGSWSLPLIVMAIIPFALVGGIIGHWLMGLQLTILSLFGLFGLSGIVVNSAIILVTFYHQQRAAGLSITDALNEAAVQRMRAVLLTSLTTIGGLLPLLFETSLQAQFLIPMATSIAFGLGFSTLLVLVVIPVLLSYLEQFHAWRERA